MSKRHDMGALSGGINLPITPMLDMSFQLLMYFILTYHPSAMEGQMDIGVPYRNLCNPPRDPPVAPQDEPLEEDFPELNVRLQAQQVGYTVTVEEGPVNTPLGSLDAMTRFLENRLKDRVASIGDRLKRVNGRDRDAVLQKELTKGTIRVQGDSNLKLACVIEVMDACRLAGTRAFREGGFEPGKLNFVRVSLAGPPDQGFGQ